MKKIFFNYADEAEDKKMMCNLCLHFAVLKNDLELWHKGKILPGDVVNDSLSRNFKDSDAALHLLSISYATEDQCVNLLNQGIQLHKKNIPVLLSSFDWESLKPVQELKDELLPEDHQPIDTHQNSNAAYTGIVRAVKKEVLGIESNEPENERPFYYMVAALALLTGVGVSVWMQKELEHIGLTLGVFSLFILTALFALRKIIYPTTVSTLKTS